MGILELKYTNTEIRSSGGRPNSIIEWVEEKPVNWEGEQQIFLNLNNRGKETNKIEPTFLDRWVYNKRALIMSSESWNEDTMRDRKDAQRKNSEKLL